MQFQSQLPVRDITDRVLNSKRVSKLTFERKYRICKRRDFVRLQLEAKRFSSAVVALSVSPALGEHSRLGLIVSTKISKRAVIRNRIKRRLRETFRDLRPQLKGSYDIIFVARPKAIESDLKSIRASCIKLLVQAGALDEQD